MESLLFFASATIIVFLIWWAIKEVLKAFGQYDSFD